MNINRAYLTALHPHYWQQVGEGVKEAFDTCHCPNCGDRSKSKGEVYQVERDECCLYACSTCHTTTSETPF